MDFLGDFFCGYYAVLKNLQFGIRKQFIIADERALFLFSKIFLAILSIVLYFRIINIFVNEKKLNLLKQYLLTILFSIQFCIFLHTFCGKSMTYYLTKIFVDKSKYGPKFQQVGQGLTLHEIKQHTEHNFITIILLHTIN